MCHRRCDRHGDGHCAIERRRRHGNEAGKFLDAATVFGLCKVARAGKNALVFVLDVVSAYKLLVYSPLDWWQQVFKVGGSFFVDMTGIFGTVTAADTWNCLITLIMMFVSEVLKMPGVDAYVDNVDLVVPPLPCGAPDVKSGTALSKLLLSFLRGLGLPLHEIEGPSTFIAKHLGWEVDTALLEVRVPRLG